MILGEIRDTFTVIAFENLCFNFFDETFDFQISKSFLTLPNFSLFCLKNSYIFDKKSFDKAVTLLFFKIK